MKVQAEALRSFCRELMMKAGVSEQNAADFAESIVNADMRGISSHGVTRLKTYYRRCVQGLVDPKAEPVIERAAASLLLVDGRNALGVVSAGFAMGQCIERARETGLCFAAVKGGNHFGYAAFFAEKAARADMIGFAAANGPSAIPPIGGREAILGTSPLAVVVPAGEHAPIELDMATSIVARGKIQLAAKEGREIPADWGVDSEGRPTTDPNAVKYLLPFGGAKGFGIGLLVEIFSSCLSGAKNAMTMGSLFDFSGKIQESGFFVGALDYSKITPPEHFRSEVDHLIRAVKDTPKAEGTEEIFVPGEIEHRKYLKALEEGVEIGPKVQAELLELSEESGIPAPF